VVVGALGGMGVGAWLVDVGGVVRWEAVAVCCVGWLMFQLVY